MLVHTFRAIVRQGRTLTEAVDEVPVLEWA